MTTNKFFFKLNLEEKKGRNKLLFHNKSQIFTFEEGWKFILRFHVNEA